MATYESEPQIREYLIKPESDRSLQDQITEAIRNGATRVALEGEFTSEGRNQFSLLTLLHDLEIVGTNGTTLDGQNKLTHLLFVADGIKVKVKGVRFIGGNTQDVSSQVNLDNHPQSRLNIFRYLDGGAITIGAGSELILEDCAFTDNHSAICGGAISNLGGYLHLRNCTFSDNSCGDTGAAIDNLAVGSLTVIENCRFSNNKANQLGSGNFGAVTAFPNTYLVILDSDFSQESATAIDYRLNKDNLSYVFVDSATRLNDTAIPIVKNPTSNTGIRKKILTRYTRLLARHPSLVKLEGISSASKATLEKHQAIYDHFASGENNRLED